MINSKKKGFTIVELVIVIAVVAILAAVLIPTFSSLVRKANIANDTAVAKNLNTAAISANAQDFDSAIKAAQESGYILANLNAKAEGCYFVWDDVNKQFLLVDIEDNYKVIYSNTGASAKENWYVAVNNTEDIASIEAAGCKVKKIAASYDDLSDSIALGGEVYVDESVIIDDDNLIVIEDAEKDVTLNLGNSVLSTNGVLTGKVPISVNSGTLNIKGGVINGAGMITDMDGEKVGNTILVDYEGKLNIDGTVFNVAVPGYLCIAGESTIKNTTINTENIGIYSIGTIVVENTTINAKGRVVWACNHAENAADAGLITIKSGKYTGGSSNWAAITTCGSFVKIEGGEFKTNEGAKFFQIHNNDNGGLSIRAKRTTGWPSSPAPIWPVNPPICVRWR